MSTETSGQDVEHWLYLYEQMYRIRCFEEVSDNLYTRGLIPGITHLYIGEEAVAVGVCSVLRDDDWITSTHRGHGHCLAKGADVGRMFAELMGRATGYCGGKGGSMHIADQDTGNLGANGIVGGSTAIVAGAGLSAKLRGTDEVAVAFFGDGALGQGQLYESMNMAALWKLPVLYVCENNHYGEYTPNDQTIAGEILDRARAFGIPSHEVDGQDIREVSRVAGEAVAAARRGDGPSFLQCTTYRYRGHHVGDVDRPYRTQAEEEEWQATRDPLQNLAAWLETEFDVESEVVEQLEAEVRTAVDDSAAKALEEPIPEASEVTTHVYA
ncbi:MAG: thiamine pyrophosphate-dependent dehydrogenase E1 component subunit alpha [Caldilineaceae bacterium SB0661_bin_34]|nr:thiamine pyrophosphate-dependent dehydrogenase E1 component subunit alpha [Caldilineaceae bacterium SB0661_bin_34]